MNRLQAIAADVRAALDARMRARPLGGFAPGLKLGAPGRFRAAIARASKAEPVRFIAEVKKASPSRGLLAGDFDPVARARAYAAGGAAAVSVLTEPRHFLGSPDHLKAVAAAVPLPALQKDFTLEAYQLHEAVELGASAVLLIAALLPSGRLAALRAAAEELGLDTLVEVHDEAELEAALASGARIVGVNNRDLRTFEVRLETTLRLAPRVPAGTTLVGESGVTGRADVLRLQDAGVDALLVGEALMRSGDPAARLRQLRGEEP
ncbi:MAG: indole-3-glycerol phosphate synthase TrpC [Candidatus Eisenbacteria bacterium]|nr:indole-3-glycerol phosphate synthase TrpC [Candidatus Eisenbacteria bacterium]